MFADGIKMLGALLGALGSGVAVIVAFAQIGAHARLRKRAQLASEMVSTWPDPAADTARKAHLSAWARFLAVDAARDTFKRAAGVGITYWSVMTCCCIALAAAGFLEGYRLETGHLTRSQVGMMVFVALMGMVCLGMAGVIGAARSRAVAARRRLVLYIERQIRHGATPDLHVAKWALRQAVFRRRAMLSGRALASVAAALCVCFLAATGGRWLANPGLVLFDREHTTWTLAVALLLPLPALFVWADQAMNQARDAPFPLLLADRQPSSSGEVSAPGSSTSA